MIIHLTNFYVGKCMFCALFSTERKHSNHLSTIISVLVAALVVLLGLLGFCWYQDIISFSEYIMTNHFSYLLGAFALFGLSHWSFQMLGEKKTLLRRMM